MINGFIQIFKRILSLPVLIGVNPKGVSGAALILFPMAQTTLFCGFAGIMAIKGATRPDQPEEPAGRLDEDFKKISQKPLHKILSGSVKPQHYLDSGDVLADMDRLILLLKSEVQSRRVFFSDASFSALFALCKEMAAFLAVEERLLEENADHFHTDELEIINSRIIQIKDILWTLERDFLDNIVKIKALCPEGVSENGFRKYRELNYLLNSLDRLEVRGRDSAGVQISFTLADARTLDRMIQALQARGLYEAFESRRCAGDLVDGSIQLSEGETTLFLSFTYKTASIIGELGRNVRELRKRIAEDQVLHVLANQPVEAEVAFAHTRWASVGSITEENCHPVNNFTLNGAEGGLKDYPRYGRGDWRINVVLNGDIDNYQGLRQVLERGDKNLIAPELTTDTKIIPLQIEQYLREGLDLTGAFRRALCDFEGSHAIAMQSNVEPGKTFLALKGSGQSIYVGLCSDQYILSSEVYGLVEETPDFLKMDGEKPSPADESVHGQIYVLDQNSTGGTDGIQGMYYDGTPFQLTAADVRHAEITTRDIDRGSFPHFFLKEISEAAQSVRKTLRGKYRVTTKKEVIFNLGEDILPKKLKKALTKGEIRNIYVIGHGTAAVAGAAIADGIKRYVKGGSVHVEAKRASELSGFSLEQDLKDCLIIAVTQSGTTTDTNRAVSMALERGATILAIVNRRQSDITHKAHGVFYTSDGRDIEMSVASTKAFYSQIVAGYVLALFIAKTLKAMTDEAIAAELANLEKIPGLMTGVLDKSTEIAASVQKVARHKKYWAIVGSGPNKAAADEIRIKLSELCYKTISSDVIEDKKHIDLSSEPLIVVCAAGNPEVVMGDIVKDVAIFKAHKSAVVVFAEEGERRFDGIADAVIGLPVAPMPIPVILNTAAGHLWGYHAACHIDSSSTFLQEFKNRLSLEMIRQDKRDLSLIERIADRELHRMIDDYAFRFHEKRQSGAFSWTNVNTISDIALLLKYAVGKLPLEDYWKEFRDQDGLGPLDLLNVTLGHAVDDLSRPIDAIRHQAKTVTVGTSRKEEVLRGVLFDLLAQLGFSIRNLSSGNILALGRIQKTLVDVKGYTLYDINGLTADGEPVEQSTISIRLRGGIALQMKSRAEFSATLMGTKKTIVRTGNVYVGFGRSDNAPITIIPLLQDKPGVRNLLLAHIAFNETLGVREKIEALADRYNDIRNMINEYNLPWDDAYLERLPIGVLLGESVEFITTKIKKALEAK